MSCSLTNCYKIANPTVLARISEDQLRALMEDLWLRTPRVVTRSQPEARVPRGLTRGHRSREVRTDAQITADDGDVRTLVLTTREDLEIA